jgi:beta-glucosidase/6-phospho-beta-glucosidase/beta-galactosidase/ABC-type amino acid transport substrate-binding protein
LEARTLWAKRESQVLRPEVLDLLVSLHRAFFVELPELLFGVATSDHQFESFDPERPDYRDVWEQQQKQTPRGKATDFWNRYPEDIQLARDLGCKLFRFSIAWSRVEPKPGEWDEAALQHYRSVATEIHKAGMLPLVTLHHFTWPIHVEDRGGMTHTDFPHWYAAYVTRVVQTLADLVSYWITFNEPNLLVYGYVKPWWQPFYLVPPGTAVATSLAGQLDSAVQLIRNIFLSHRSAREIIQTKNPQAKVGANPFVLGLPVLLQYFIDWMATRMRDQASFQKNNRRMAEQTLLSHTPVDVVIARFTPTPERLQQVAFSEVYAEGAQRLVVRKESKISGPEELNGRGVGVVRGTTARKNVLTNTPAANIVPFANHRLGLEALAAGQIEGFIADDTCVSCLPAFPNLEMRGDAIARSVYAVGVARGNPDLLNIVNAVLTNRPTPSIKHPTGSALVRRIRNRGYLRVGVSHDPSAGAPDELSQQEVDLAAKLAARLFGDSENVRFEKLDFDQRIASLSTPARFLEPLLKPLAVVGTVLNSNWWHLGMAGKLSEFLCPTECIDTQDFVGLDYYWGISSIELHRMHQLVDASLSNFFGAPVDPPGLLRALRRFHRWFKGKEILIIENGCIESAGGFTRSQYLRSHLEQVKQARKLGIPVRGYICWSITSNREWGLKFNANSDFGLYHIDLDTDPALVRKPTECARVYKEAIQAMRE